MRLRPTRLGLGRHGPSGVRDHACPVQPRIRVSNQRLPGSRRRRLRRHPSRLCILVLVDCSGRWELEAEPARSRVCAQRRFRRMVVRGWYCHSTRVRRPTGAGYHTFHHQHLDRHQHDHNHASRRRHDHHHLDHNHSAGHRHTPHHHRHTPHHHRHTPPPPPAHTPPPPAHTPPPPAHTPPPPALARPRPPASGPVAAVGLRGAARRRRSWSGWG